MYYNTFFFIAVYTVDCVLCVAICTLAVATVFKEERRIHFSKLFCSILSIFGNPTGARGNHDMPIPHQLYTGPHLWPFIMLRAPSWPGSSLIISTLSVYTLMGQCALCALFMHMHLHRCASKMQALRTQNRVTILKENVLMGNYKKNVTDFSLSFSCSFFSSSVHLRSSVYISSLLLQLNSARALVHSVKRCVCVSFILSILSSPTHQWSLLFCFFPKETRAEGTLNILKRNFPSKQLHIR